MVQPCGCPSPVTPSCTRMIRSSLLMRISFSYYATLTILNVMEEVPHQRAGGAGRDRRGDDTGLACRAHRSAGIIMGAAARPSPTPSSRRGRTASPALRTRGLATATTSPSSWRTTRLPRGGLGGPAVGAVLHRAQQPSAQRRGAVHPRRLRRHRSRDLPGHGRRRRRASTCRGSASALSRRRRARRLRRYEDVGRAVPGARVADECEGREMLYSSGTTGQPKGVRKALPAHRLGDPSAAPVQIAMGLAARGVGPGRSTCRPRRSTTRRRSSTPCPCSAWAPRSSSWSTSTPRQCLELIERHGVTHAQFVPTMFVGMLKLPDEERAALRPVEPRYVVHAAAPCPVDGEAPDARVVGPDHPRVLRRHRGHRVDLDHRRRSGWPTRLGRAAADPGPHRRARRRGAAAPGRRASSTSRAAGPSSTTTTRGKTASITNDRGLAHPGRRRLPRRGRLPLPHRPPGPHDHLRRGEHLPPGGRERPRRPSRRRRRAPSSACPTPRWARR